MPDARPTLIYDGDCGICKYWVRYWRALTNGRVDYRAYQDAAADYPRIALEAFRRAIQFIEPDGQVYSGAAANYRVLRYAPGRGGWWWWYVHVPGFALTTEWAYDFFARRRGLLNRLTRLLWGPALEPAQYDLVSWVFLRLFGLIYVAAFASLGAQILGLVGSAGVLPLEPYLQAVRAQIGVAAYRELPTLFWLDASDTALVAGTAIGVALGVLVILGIAQRAALIGLFALYLSYVYAGQVFMAFQWDLLLLEAGFLAIFLTGGSRVVVWLYRWLVFRFLFMAGVVKLLSGDPTWRGFTALAYHFETQPLPTPLAWYAAQLPHGLAAAGTAATLAVELGLVLLIFAPRRLRAAAAWCVIAFQAADRAHGQLQLSSICSRCCSASSCSTTRRCAPSCPRGLSARVAARARRPGRTATTIATVVALIVVPVGVNRVWQRSCASDLPVAVPCATPSPLLIVNPYGLFAVMTTTRPEIVVEGSDDGPNWREYEFRYKPGRCIACPRRGTFRTSRGSTGRCGSPRWATHGPRPGSSASCTVCWRTVP